MDAITDAIIENVRLHSCIYDKSHRDFKNIMEKEKAWAEIAEACERPKEDCKRKWVTLREKFTKEFKKNDLPSGNEAYEVEWPYYESMLFLKQFIQPRKTRKNTFDSSELETESDTTSQQEHPVPKKTKNNKFDEACEAVQRAAERITTEPPIEVNSRRKTNENFMRTICDLMEPLPEDQQDSAMCQMLTYVTDLRKTFIHKN